MVNARLIFVGLLISLASCQRLSIPERSQKALPEDVEISSNEVGRYGGTLVATNSGEPTGFHPLVIEDADTAEISELMLSGLTTQDPVTQETVPALAKSWELSPDRKTYTFHLRRGLRWSDGQPLTADDVIFTFDAVMATEIDPKTGQALPRFPNRYIQQYTLAGKPIRYEKIDDLTVRFITPELYAPFINDVGFINILPKHKLHASFLDGSLLKQWTVETAIKQPQELVCSGPFTLLSYRPGDRLILQPNPHYWRADRSGQRLPYLDLYVVKFVKDANAELVNFATGQSDYSPIPAPDVGWVKRGEKTYDYTVHERGPSTGISFIWFNQKPGQDANGKPYLPPYKLKWFQDRRFRQALAYGFNREGIIQGVFFGRARPLHSMISEANLKWHYAGTPRFDYQPERAKAMLREAGFQFKDSLLYDAEGNQVQFELLLPQGSATAPQIINSFSEDMKKLGIFVKISPIEFSTLIARVSQTFDYEASIMGFTGGGDPSGGKAIYLSSGRMHLWNPNQPKPATPWEARIDTLMELQEKSFDPAQRKAYVDEIQSILAEERPLLFLVTPDTYLGLKK
ncbi:MAG: ABC transporter substrate-binding protein [Blastochloris sp.]|nr:ABC transporter substrate-binding protein [Blastochloris sp.]